MVAQGNNVYIAWMDIKPGQKQVMFRASNDSGQTFGNPVVVYGNAAAAILPPPPSSSTTNTTTTSSSIPGLP